MQWDSESDCARLGACDGLDVWMRHGHGPGTWDLGRRSRWRIVQLRRSLVSALPAYNVSFGGDMELQGAAAGKGPGESREQLGDQQGDQQSDRSSVFLEGQRTEIFNRQATSPPNGGSGAFSTQSDQGAAHPGRPSSTLLALRSNVSPCAAVRTASRAPVRAPTWYARHEFQSSSSAANGPRVMHATWCLFCDSPRPRGGDNSMAH